MVKVCLIGAGYLGRFHALNLRALELAEKVQFKGLFDIDRHRALQVSKEAETRAFNTLEEAISEADALVIASSTSTHYEIAMKALKAGRDVFIEKPITTKTKEAEELVEEAKKRGLIIQVGHLERFNPAVLKAMEMLDSPVFYEAERLSPLIDRARDMDITLDLMIHDIDIVLSLSASKVEDIKVAGAKVLTDRIDVVKAWLVFDNGTQACLTAGRLSRHKRRLLRIFQDTAMLEIDYQRPALRVYRKGSSGIESQEYIFEEANPIRAELEDFVSVVRDRRPPKVGANQALEAMELAIKISEMLGGVGGQD